MTCNVIMSSVSLEQISTWFTRTLWPFLKDNPAVLGAILVVLLLLILRRKLTRSVPRIADCQVRVEPCDLPPCRFFTGTIVASNKGSKSYSLQNLKLSHGHYNFEISDITDRRNKEITPPERGVIGIKLPIKFRAREKREIYFFGYHRIAKTEELPEKLSLIVTFSGRRNAFLYSLVRVLDQTYCLRPPDKYPPKRLR